MTAFADFPITVKETIYTENLIGPNVKVANLSVRDVLTAEEDPAFQEMLDTPFRHWERTSFTIDPCNYCGQRDCDC